MCVVDNSCNHKRQKTHRQYNAVSRQDSSPLLGVTQLPSTAMWRLRCRDSMQRVIAAREGRVHRLQAVTGSWHILNLMGSQKSSCAKAPSSPSLHFKRIHVHHPWSRSQPRQERPPLANQAQATALPALRRTPPGDCCQGRHHHVPAGCRSVLQGGRHVLPQIRQHLR